MFVSHDIGAAKPATDDFWYMPAGQISSSGALVTQDTALRLSTVYKCVRIRSETIGMLPIIVHRRLPNGGKEVARDHELYSLLHDQPNPWQTAMEWKAMGQAHLDMRGNAYSQIVYNGAGRVDMLVPLHPDCVTVEVLPNGLPRYRYRSSSGERVLVFGEMLHVRGMSADGYVGLNPIALAREAIGAGIASRDYGAKYFANAARTPTWIKFAGKFKDDDAKRKWVQDFSQAYGGGNSGRTPVMENGMELMALPLAQADQQYILQRQHTDIDIAGLFRMPPHKLGILDRATWGNIEHQQIDFVTDTIMPSCVAFEQAALRDLPFGEDYFPEYKLQMLLRGDTKTRYEAYGKAIQDGWMVRNEARSMENMNPLDGLDEPLVPLNMGPAGSREADRVRGNPAGQGASGERGVLIAMAAAERVARKEAALIARHISTHTPLAELFEGHDRWVADVMGVSPMAAAAHVVDTLARFEALSQSGQLTKTLREDFIATQSAALLRLED